MKNSIFNLFILLLIGCQSQFWAEPPIINETQSKKEIIYYPETGHTIQHPFLSFYQNHNGLTRLGYPITEMMTHDGWQVQYFQYGRLEVHPENSPDYFITVGWLGQLSHRTQAPILNVPIGDSLYFSETGHSISGDFLTFFEANGGTPQFGQPISEAFLNDGLLNQDFQSARFIWRPLLPQASRVQLEPLGETYFLSSNLPLSHLEAIPAPAEAEIYSSASIPIPANSVAKLQIELTPRPNIVRIIALFSNQGEPIQNYAPRLKWKAYNRILPPSNLAGQTHTLVDITAFKRVEFILQDQGSGDVLTSVEIENSVNSK